MRDLSSGSILEMEAMLRGPSSTLLKEDSDVDGALEEVDMKVDWMPASVRLGFIRKVYGIVTAMLLVSLSAAVPFVLWGDAATGFLRSHPWIYWASFAVFLSQMLANLFLVTAGCLCRQRAVSLYMEMFKRAPWNYAYMFLHASSMGVLVGFACARCGRSDVALAFGLTAVLVLSATAYAYVTQNDFTGYGMYVMDLALVLVFLLLAPLIGGGGFLKHLPTALGALVFGFVTVYDSQLIFGTATKNVTQSACGRIAFSVDMYAFAAFQLYLDFLGVFGILLRGLAGSR